MQAKEVLVLLTDRWADWEAAYAIAPINSDEAYTVKTIAADKGAKVSIGGIRAEIDYTIGSYRHFDNLAMLILPGGYAWREGRHEEIAEFVKKIIALEIPVAAICGATLFLGKHGFLDKVKHTGNDLARFQKEQGYNGQDFYVSAQVAVDKGIITANETAAVEFAHGILGLLNVYDDVDDWYDYFKNGIAR